MNCKCKVCLMVTESSPFPIDLYQTRQVLLIMFYFSRQDDFHVEVHLFRFAVVRDTSTSPN